MNYKRIRALREDKDLRQRELADYLNCSQVAYSYYELG
ncbi:MAG: helix-turn-helix transcriptional regulator, partial [Selenomonadaceae bacterium]|nr:helix-turn-helix transcriptional regulator [Selenomonadaceae bacterium]MBR3722504.1 helix-turn-helix transcriptional regulator [Selenomonadaceae bacterium]